MSKYFNVAMVQIASTSMNPDIQARKVDHLNVMSHYIDNISVLHPTVDMIVFPELYIPGVDPMNWLNMAETIPGPSIDLVRQKAKQLKKWIVPGSIFEIREGGQGAYNTAVLVSPDGDIVLKYRKVFIPYPLEPSTPGSDFPVFHIPGVGKVGIMICADAHVPEIARNLVFNGAEIIIKPTYQPYWIGNVRNHTVVCQTRAIENQCYVVSVNQPSPLCMGNSCTCDPEGRIIEELECSEGYCIVSLDMDNVKKARQNGSFETFQLLKLFRDFKVMGIPVDQCYLNGFENSPLFSGEPKTPAAKTPSDLKHA